MKIYYDDKCRICCNIADFCVKQSSSSLIFETIYSSKYHSSRHDTIVVVDGNHTYTYGAALRAILGKLDAPYWYFSFFPVGILTLCYKVLRYIRRYL